MVTDPNGLDGMTIKRIACGGSHLLDDLCTLDACISVGTIPRSGTLPATALAISTYSCDDLFKLF